MTDIAGTGDVTWDVTFVQGTYTFQCDRAQRHHVRPFHGHWRRAHRLRRRHRHRHHHRHHLRHRHLRHHLRLRLHRHHLRRHLHHHLRHHPPPPPPPPPPPTVRCHVPRVIGLTLGKAKTKIRRARCSVGRIRRARSTASRPRDRPEPEAGRRSSAAASRSSSSSAGANQQQDDYPEGLRRAGALRLPGVTQILGRSTPRRPRRAPSSRAAPAP